MQKYLSLLERFNKYLLAALIILIPLYPKFPFMRIPGTYVSIRFEDFLMVVLALVLIPKIIPNLKRYLKNRVIQAILVFLLVGLVSLLSAMFLTKTVVAHIGFLHFLRRIEYFVAFFAGFILLRGTGNLKECLEFFLKCLLIVVFVAFIYGLGQRYFGWPVIVTQNEEYSKGMALKWIPGSHINSTFAGHYDLASYLVLVLPIFITSFFTLRGKWTKITLAVGVLCGLWLLTNSVSRISAVSFLVASTFALVLIHRYKEVLLVWVVSLIFFGTSLPLVGRYLNLKNIFSLAPRAAYAQSASPLATPKPKPAPILEDRSTSIRLNVEWPRAIRAFSKNPILGTGYSSITLATDNDFLRLLGETGILGFAAFIILLFKVVAVWLKSLPITKKFSGVEIPFLAGLIGAFSGVILNSLFIDLFEASKFAIMFWSLVGISLYLIETRLNEQQI